MTFGSITSIVVWGCRCGVFSRGDYVFCQVSCAAEYKRPRGQTRKWEMVLWICFLVSFFDEWYLLFIIYASEDWDVSDISRCVDYHSGVLVFLGILIVRKSDPNILSQIIIFNSTITTTSQRSLLAVEPFGGSLTRSEISSIVMNIKFIILMYKILFFPGLVCNHCYDNIKLYLFVEKRQGTNNVLNFLAYFRIFRMIP